jgi:2-polyprenyl-3-methyl-5-hydroxy-6-metoxy-1,4-benzoquinol methylase
MISVRFKYDKLAVLKLNPVQLAMKEQIDSKVDNKHYAFEQVPCAVCRTDGFSQLSEKDRYGLYYPVVICKTCGLVQTNPRMTQAAYNEFYDTEYRKLYNASEKPSALFFTRQYRRGKSIFDYLKCQNLLPPKGSLVLEVGCGAGGILEFFRQQGYKVLGIDLGEEYLAYGRMQYGLDLRQLSLSELDPEEKPGLIIYAHVFEHILDLPKELTQISRISSDSTQLYIEVPGLKNVRSMYDYDFLEYFQNAHTYHFSLTTLRNILSGNGFKLVHGNEYVRSVFRMGPAGAEKEFQTDYAPALKYIRLTEKTRFLHYFTKNYIKNVLLKILYLTGVKKR